MLRRVTGWVGVAIVLGVGVASALSNSPPVTRTNAKAFGTGLGGVGNWPAEGNCTACHSSFPLNDVNGAVTIDAPDFYMANGTYPVTVHLNYSLADTAGASNPKWGFQVTAIRASDGNGIGTFVTPAPGPSPTFPESLTIGTITSGPHLGSGRTYIRQSGFATRTDSPSPVQWTFNWQAPGTDQGKIYFYAAGNAANGNSSSSLDHIFTTSDSTAFTSAVPATAGSAWLVMVGAGLLLTGGFFLTRQAVRCEV